MRDGTDVAKPDDSSNSSASRRARDARRAITFGISLFLICFVLLFSPMLIGAKLGKFVVAPAIVGVCWGLSCVLHGGWDRWRRGERDRSA